MIRERQIQQPSFPSMNLNVRRHQRIDIIRIAAPQIVEFRPLYVRFVRVDGVVCVGGVEDYEVGSCADFAAVELELLP